MDVVAGLPEATSEGARGEEEVFAAWGNQELGGFDGGVEIEVFGTEEIVERGYGGKDRCGA